MQRKEGKLKMESKKIQFDIWDGEKKCKLLQKRFGDYDVFMEKGGNKENKIPIFNLIHTLSEKHNGQLTLLDIGCGPGHFLWSFKDKFSKLIGLDYSQHMLKLASEQLNKVGIDAEFFQGSCWDLPLPDNFVDITLQVDVCMHIGGSWDSIKEMIRVSKKYVVFTGPSFESFDNVMDKKIASASFAVSIPLLRQELDKLDVRYQFLERPRTKTYDHRILFIEV